MICVFCGKETNVVNSRPGKRHPSVWRRRKCDYCKAAFSSREKPDFAISVRVKKQAGIYEPFLEDKLFISIKESLSHRSDALEASRQLTDTITAQIFPLKGGYLKPEEIIATAYAVIRRFDRAAATYYRAHHRLETRK
ncbi:hypothetical protein KY385_03230 [Candidatus Parcubacteria bacterium]|nr:hypothetical protein [Candidatus Parcubacteria bacterium]